MKTILAVDQDTLFLDLLVHVLRSDRLVSAVTARSSGDARKLFDLHGPAMLIIDPTMDGAVDLLKYIRTTDACVTAVALSRPGGEASLAAVHALGVQTIIDRGRGMEPLLLAVRECLEEGPENESPNEQVSVLVVDDDRELREFLEHFLGTRGYSVLSAGDAQEAQDVIAATPSLSVVLLDIILPGKGGLQLLRELMSRSHPLGVIMMTAIADEEIARQSMRFGAFDYLLKADLNFDTLDALILACATRVDYQRKWWDYELEDLRRQAADWIRSIMERSGDHVVSL